MFGREELLEEAQQVLTGRMHGSGRSRHAEECLLRNVGRVEDVASVFEVAVGEVGRVVELKRGGAKRERFDDLFLDQRPDVRARSARRDLAEKDEAAVRV